MRNIVKILSLLSIIALIPGAYAATSRVSVMNKNASRLPSIAGHLVSSGTTVTTASTTSSSSTAYYTDSDCIEKYTDCIKADDVCGSEMQECTTNVLFHGQMANCLSVLYQCSSSGINALFGTSAIGALSTVASTDTKDGITEVTRYTYPTDGSVLGQLIIGASITNKLTTEQCVRRYTNCLHRDDICGESFELCTTPRAFKKQALLCDSSLQRCQNDGKIQLFGSVANATALNPTGDARLKQMMEEGAATAAKNAVLTCQKVTDTCLYNACVKNPLRCVEGIDTTVIASADFVADGGSTNDVAAVKVVTDTETYTGTTATDATSVRKMLKSQCLETIGMNKYCHMTYRELMPSDRDLVDIDLQEDVFALAYSARKSAVNTRIQEAVKKFDTKAKNNCMNTIKECAMRSCGGGLGSVCYKLAYESNSGVQVNRNATYGDIRAGCAAIVNADANCIYAAASSTEDGYVYTYYDEDNTTFSKLFPDQDHRSTDPIGAVATLNSLLSTSYNDAAIEKMKKQCQTVALSCVKSMCGKDYTNCYRNRTDILVDDGSGYSTGDSRLDRSMNKVGGILDYNIVIGLCMNTVKNSSVCEEHLKVATADWRNAEYRNNENWIDANGNQYGSVREGWLDSNTIRINETSGMNDVVVACGLAAGQDSDNCPETLEPVDNGCIGVSYEMDGVSCIYDQPITVKQSEYVLKNGAKTLFQTLLVDVEKEVQAKYNAKITKEQNICTGNNYGGILGNRDNGKTFMWVKLKSNRVPKNYTTKGLKATAFNETGDLYGAFCRARITVQSDDRDIQKILESTGSSVAYFAVGDSFTCGSWIDDNELRKISEQIGQREICKQGYGTWKDGQCLSEGIQNLSVKEKLSYAWGTVGPALAGMGIGLGLTESGAISGLIQKGNEKNSISSDTLEKYRKQCGEYADQAKEAAGEAYEKLTENKDSEATFSQYKAAANRYASLAYNACQTMGMSASDGCVRRSIELPHNDKKDSSTGRDIQKFIGDMDALASSCENYTVDLKNARSAKAARTIIPIATTLASGALGAGITASVIKMNKENIKNTAAQQWMDEVGEHIQCYIGTDELGSYGDVVSIELD